MNGWGGDLRHAWRLMLGRPLFSVVAVVTLALGIGANTAVFSVLDAILLEPLPYEDADRIVMLWGTSNDGRTVRDQVSATDIADLRASTTTFEEMAAFANWRPTLSGDGEATRIAASMVGDGFFQVMRGRAQLGRLFAPEDQEDGNDRVVVISHGLWQRRYGGAADVVGMTIRLNLVPYDIVGVLDPEFESLPRGILIAPADLYRPLAEPADDRQRSARHLRAVGRIAPGSSIGAAQSEVDVVAARLAESYPEDNAGSGIRLVALKEDLVGRIRPTLLMLLGAVGIVLITACINVGNLFLTQARTRGREIAIRTAVGAGRWRIVRQLMIESLLLSGVGALAGLLLAVWSLDGVRALGRDVHPMLGSAQVDGSVLAFTAGVAFVSAVLFGIVPAWRSSRSGVEEALRSGGDGRTVQRQGRLGNVFLVAEITLALVLVVGAGLVTRSVQLLYRVDPGFDISNKLVLDLYLPWKTYREGPKQVALYEAALARIGGLPGVSSAGVTSLIPLGGSFDRVGVEVEGQEFPPNREPSPDRFVVSPGYLRTMEIALLKGRLLDGRDVAGGDPVVLISETMASQLWPGEDPLGKRIRLPGDQDNPQPWRSVAGVVRDVKIHGLDHQGSMQLYLPHAQTPWSFMSFVIETENDPTSIASAVREEIRGLDEHLPIFNVSTLADMRDHSISEQRFTMWMLAGFAGIALLLAAVGIYGVFAYAVSLRTREFGVRIALGARGADVLRDVLGRGALLTGGGLVLGLFCAGLLTRSLQRLLFGVGTVDPLTFATAAGILGGVALLACWLPARRAARIDPAICLRQD